MVFSADNGGFDKTLELDRDSDNWICAFRGNSGAGCITYDTNNEWTHAVIVYSGGNKLDLYVNGVLEVNGGSTNFDTSQGYLSFGNNGESGEYFNGKIDEVMIFNRALSAEEVKNLYDIQKD